MSRRWRSFIRAIPWRKPPGCLEYAGSIVSLAPALTIASWLANAGRLDGFGSGCRWVWFAYDTVTTLMGSLAAFALIRATNVPRARRMAPGMLVWLATNAPEAIALAYGRIDLAAYFGFGGGALTRIVWQRQPDQDPLTLPIALDLCVVAGVAARLGWLAPVCALVLWARDVVQGVFPPQLRRRLRSVLAGKPSRDAYVEGIGTSCSLEHG